MKEITLSRKELYDLVWSTPMTQIAKKYEISDNGLRKICKRHEIPIPSIGHWQRIAHGRKTSKIKFVEKTNDPDKISLRLRDGAIVKNLIPRATAETYPEMDFKVPKQLTEPHKLIIQSEKILRAKIKELQKHNPGYQRLMNCWEGISMEISPATVERALCFMDTLIKILYKRGHSVECSHGTYVIIGQQRIKISLREKTTSIAGEKRYSWDSYDYVPNGKLCFKTDIWRRKEWSDGRLALEDQLPQILQKLEDAAEEMRQEQIANEERRRENERKEALRREREALEDKELKALQMLMSQAKRWEQIKMLRNYINDMESMAKSKGNLDDKMASWIIWAKEKADWFDPSINREDELLEHVDKHTLNMQRNHSNDYSYFYDRSSQKEYNFWQSSWWNQR